jgi:uncharacterized protein (TIGR00297 family)
MSEAASIVLLRLFAGLLLSAVVGLLAYRRGSLAPSGVAGAILTGTLIFGFGGLISGLLLIAFFVSSSLLTHFKAARKQAVAETFDKTGRRDLGQALANGGAAALCAVLGAYALFVANSAGGFVLWHGAFLGALAAANADTWATELGVLSKRAPRLLTRPWQHVAPGTSGGVTRDGTLAALGGAAFIGAINLLLALAFGPLRYANNLTPASALIPWLVAATVAGLAGSLFDSLLGATVQAMYYSDRRDKETERPLERDGTPNHLTRGWRWLNNDWVNFISTCCGAAVGALITLAFTFYV